MQLQKAACSILRGRGLAELLITNSKANPRPELSGPMRLITELLGIQEHCLSRSLLYVSSQYRNTKSKKQES